METSVFGALRLWLDPPSDRAGRLTEIAKIRLRREDSLGRRPIQLADFGKKQLDDRGMVRLMVGDDHVKRGHFSLYRPGGY